MKCMMCNKYEAKIRVYTKKYGEIHMCPSCFLTSYSIFIGGI